MIRFRPFLNSDPPAISEIWRSHPPARGLMQPMTPGVLEEQVFSKPYFDPQGLILALDDGAAVGFVHAGYGPDDTRAGLDHSQGITCLLMVSPENHRAELAAGLLAASESYLAGQGARTFLGGCIGHRAPFYVGLYGGSLAPGVLRSDGVQVEAYRTAGYEEAGSCLVWQRELAGFRPAIDREFMQMRRRFALARSADAAPRDWWEACTVGQLDVVQFDLLPGGKGPAVASVGFWDMEPLASSWGVHAVGMLFLHIEEDEGRGRLATFLLGEAIRELQSYGTQLVEVQTDVADRELLEACRRLGFREVDQGVQFRKQMLTAC